MPVKGTGARVKGAAVGGGGEADGNDKAKVSSDDTTAGYLNGKLVAGDGITFTEGSPGGNETLAIAMSASEELYGGGADGDVTLTGNTTLTGEMFYNNLTLDPGVTLNLAGYILSVKGTLTVPATARVTNSGAAGSGTTGGATAGRAQLGGTGSFGAGGNGGTAAGTAGTSSVTAFGGSGGAGGAGSGGAGGAGGTAAASTGSRPSMPLAAHGMFANSSGSVTNARGGLGGGGGGGNGSLAGGGGGGGGGVAVIRCKTLVNGGQIDVNGGAGAAGPGTDRGGGGGGGGGYMLLIRRTKSGAGTITATGGAGGASGGGSGVAGAAGEAGVIQELVA